MEEQAKTLEQPTQPETPPQEAELPPQTPATVEGDQGKGYMQPDYGGPTTVIQVGWFAVVFGIIVLAAGIFAVWKGNKMKRNGGGQ